MIRIGTSGFSYDDWVGPVYPPDLPASEHLGYYAHQFSTVEINTTFYRVPALRMVEGWVRKTPPDFLFSLKAYRGLTHEREAPDFAGFAQSLRPVIDAGKLGCVLAQFPYSFHPTAANRDFLRRLRDGLPDLPVVTEFRHSGWISQVTLDLLHELGLGYCCVDEPDLRGLMPRLVVATAPIGYVRFHGRNSAKWYNHKEAWERYDYTYSTGELREWTPKLAELDSSTSLTLVYFNNHFAGQSVLGARALGQLLDEVD
jgi:uncharacterized protein YecE (DUF72 family)